MEVRMTTTEAELRRLRDDIQKLRADIEHLGTTLGRAARESFRTAGENVCDATEDLRANWRTTADHVAENIKDNPVRAALAALGVGLLLGGLFSNNRS